LKRLLLPTKAFVRSARRFVQKQPQRGPELQLTLELLATDAFHQQLKTHKLKGHLARSWACSAGMTSALFFNL
jgi:mRNA-degrading endonuclease YafQ of YafQ-DinJ toxin-antitoxin module